MISATCAVFIAFFATRAIYKSRAATTITNMASTTSPKRVKILVINPNSNKDMTHGLDELVASLAFSPELTQITTYTAPSGPNSINNEEDANQTAVIILNDFEDHPDLNNYDAYVVACYSQHPLVPALRKRQRSQDGQIKPVVGIFEASISLSLNIVNSSGLVFGAGGEKETLPSKFGIVTTGRAWIPVLTMGVNAYLGSGDSEENSQSRAFKGVESTGLNADELHTAPEEEVRHRMIDATRRQLKDKDVCVVILGCAGMAGMDRIVRDAAVQELGKEDGEKVVIVDGVKAAIAMADGMLRGM